MSTDAPIHPSASPLAAAATPVAGALPTDAGACHALIRELSEQLQAANGKAERLEQYLQQLLRRIYGRSAEKLDAQQLALFEQALAQLNPPAQGVPVPPSEPAPAPTKPNSNGHGRRRLAADLPRRRLVIDLPEGQKPCPCCGKVRGCIGEEVTEKLDWEPAKVFVIERVRLKYGCAHCEQTAAETGPQIVTAALPLEGSPIDKGMAAPGLLAHVIVSKYADHLPLHRLERILERHGIDIARSTMCDWAAQCADVLRPVYDLMVREVLASRVIHTDDTPVDVLDKQKPGTTKTGRFWVYLGDPRNPSTVFTYTASRSRDGPMAFLKGWGKNGRVFLQADAFGGYDGIYRGEAGGQVTEVACWAHARRKFYEARTTDAAVSAQALAYIRLLYDVEDRARAVFEQQAEGDSAKPLAAIRLALRQEQSVPRLGQFRAWLESQRAERGGSVLPKSPMGQAITYVLNQWEALCVYTTDGALAIDNNASENALRRIAVGRKGWLFCGSDAGGRTAAVLFSVIATCQRHRINPFDYLRDVLTRIAAHPNKDLAQLLPGRWIVPVAH